MKFIHKLIRKYDIWYKWHSTVCKHTQWHTEPYGLRGTKGFRRWLYKLQLPICKWLDDIAHS